jgi:hypothetical protein
MSSMPVTRSPSLGLLLPVDLRPKHLHLELDLLEVILEGQLAKVEIWSDLMQEDLLGVRRLPILPATSSWVLRWEHLLLDKRIFLPLQRSSRRCRPRSILV